MSLCEIDLPQELFTLDTKKTRTIYGNGTYMFQSKNYAKQLLYCIQEKHSSGISLVRVVQECRNIRQYGNLLCLIKMASILNSENNPNPNPNMSDSQSFYKKKY